MLRLFISLDVSEKAQHSCQQEMRRLQKALASLSRGIRWIPSQSLHFTLQFLGNTPEDMAPKIQQALEPISFQFQPFLVQWESIQAFPSLRKPRILYFSIAQGGPQMQAIAQWAGELDYPAQPLTLNPLPEAEGILFG